MSIIGGVASAHSFANTFGSVGKKLLLTATYGAGGGMAYAKGMSENDGKWAPWKWDADNSKYSEQLKPTIEKMRIIIGQAFDDIRKDIFQSSSVKLQGSVKHKLLEIQKTRPLVLPKDGLGLQFSTHHQQSTKKPAQELPKTPAASYRLVAMEDVKNQIKNRQNEVFTDREIGTSGCRSGLGNRRPKRETIATVCRVPVPDTGKLSQLKEDPVAGEANSRKTVASDQLGFAFD